MLCPKRKDKHKFLLRTINAVVQVIKPTPMMMKPMAVPVLHCPRSILPRSIKQTEQGSHRPIADVVELNRTSAVQATVCKAAIRFPPMSEVTSKEDSAGSGHPATSNDRTRFRF